MFKERGLAQLAPEKPGVLEYFGGKRVTSMYRDLYVANIAALMFAEFSGSTFPTTYNYFSLLAATVASKFLPVPRVAAAFQNPSLEVRETFSRLGFTQQEYRNMVQFIGQPTQNIVREVLPLMPAVDCATPMALCNLRGYMAWATSVKLVQNFLVTNGVAILKGMENTSVIAIRREEGKQSVFPAYSAAKSDGKQAYFEDEDKEYAKCVGAGLGPQVLSLVRTQVGKLSSFFGSASDLPSYDHNLVFSYFEGMQMPDFTVPLSVIRSHFHNNLGISAEQCVETYAMLRRGWKSLSTTSAGMVLCHIFQGIQLALETSTSLYVLMEGDRYLGFVLQAPTAFWVAVRSKIITSCSLTQAKIDVALSSSHTKALFQICKILSDITLAGQTTKEIITRSQIVYARQLYNEVQRRKPGTESGNEIKKWADYLNFPHEYLKVTPMNLCKAFKAFSGQEALPVETPMYLGSGIILIDDPAVAIMASFGNHAPSLIMPKGESCDVPVPGIERDASKITDASGRVFMGFIAVYMKNVRQAGNDLRDVFKKRRVLFKRGLKGGAAKNSYQFVGDAKDGIWTELAGAISYKATMEAVARGDSGAKDKGKRKATDDGDKGEGPSKKQKGPEEYSQWF